MKLQTCEVGPFGLPGICLVPDPDETITEAQLNEMAEWCLSEFGTGMRMTDRLWSFRKQSQRDWFILRWSSKV